MKDIPQVETEEQAREVCEMLGWDYDRVLFSSIPHYPAKLWGVKRFNVILKDQWITLYPEERDKVRKFLGGKNGN